MSSYSIIIRLFTLIFSIIALICSIVCLGIVVQRKGYVRNIETKLNIYEQSYDNYCLEDALKQQEEINE